MEDSPLGLDKWFAAIWLITNAKNGISSYEIHRAVGVTQKSAWFLLHRIRMAMKTGSFEKPSDGGSSPGGNAEAKEPAEFEADETFIGGQRKFMHKARKEKLGKGRGTIGKEIVMGILARSIANEPSRMLMAKRIPNTDMGVLQAEVRAVVKPGSHLYTDALRAYNGLGTDYLHEAVDHEIEYVKGRVHTNGMENFWSLFKRALKGTYTHMSGVHLDRYVDEQAFRFNEREMNDSQRFRTVVSSVKGKRLTYRGLTGRDAREAKATRD
jgi:transposase-like protein